MKRKIITMTLVILSVFALASVGFASWVITFNESKDQEGSIAVETVEDKTHAITVLSSYKGDGEIELVDLDLNFCADTTAEVANSWLVASGTEDMTATIYFTVTNASTANVTVSLSIADVDSESFETANAYDSKALVVKPLSLSAEAVGSADSNGTQTYKVDITFTWGAAFEQKNPYEYYNDQAYTAELGAKAKAALKALEDLAAYKFKVTITTTNK